MSKKHFALKLIPCRPSFAMDMTEAERTVMEQHKAYLTDLMQKGTILVYGPILDPAGPYGFAIAAVDNESEVAEITANDPASSINKYEVYPMLAITPDMVTA